MRDPGYIVETKYGKTGRTFHKKGDINGKTPVFYEVNDKEYSDKAVLCDPKTLKIKGFID